ncbi:MAG: HD domain-containing protein [Lachnospiraceae bacterium]|nr:HD domain-containing protein [Lachnospiraceae bacterium]
MELGIDRERVKQAFAQYVRQYNAEDEKILLKILHTYRVAEISERIAVGLGLSAYDTDLAWLIGMLHDIGRFEQLRQYGTFVDADSIDHAHFGVDLLFRDGLIRDYVDVLSAGSDAEGGDLHVIRVAIWNHSAYRIEEGLDERTLLFCKIIRDADKVDIFKVAYDTPLEVLYRCSLEEFQNAAVSPEVIQAYQEGHAVLRSLKKTPVDFLVGHIALVFELEFPVSRKITQEQGYVQKLLSFQSNHPETAMVFVNMRKQMEAFLND